jgi:hypothetical protein
LWFGLVTHSNLGQAPLVASVTIGAIVMYVIAWRLLGIIWPRMTHWPNERFLPLRQITHIQSMVLWALTLLLAIIFLTHMLMLGHIPILIAMSSDDEYSISVIRQQAYFDLPVWMRYASDYSFKALGPALLLISVYFRQRVFWVVLLVSSLYALAMFVRVLPLVLLMPLLVYLLLQRDWKIFVLIAGLFAVVIAISTSASAPTIRESFASTTVQSTVSAQDQQIDTGYKTKKFSWRSNSVLYALFDRMIFVPSQVIDQWLRFYSHTDRLEQGCGYRTLTRLMNCKYVDVPSKLYEVYYQDNVARGMRGSLNAASFMTDYANFGVPGVAGGVILAAIVFCLITCIYRDHPLAVPMNLPLILASMETSFITALNSGSGWFAMTVLFLFFFRIGKA